MKIWQARVMTREATYLVHVFVAWKIVNSGNHENEGFVSLQCTNQISVHISKGICSMHLKFGDAQIWSLIYYAPWVLKPQCVCDIFLRIWFWFVYSWVLWEILNIHIMLSKLLWISFETLWTVHVITIVTF